MKDREHDEQEIDESRIEEVRWKIAAGYYELPHVQEEAFDRLLRALRKAE